jgi:glycosyltransferase involved in cell wall biosynthesis
MVIGLPFVASDIPSIRETVGDSYTLYSPSDTRSLCRALEKNYLNKTPKDSSLQTDVKNRFDHNLRFREFLDVLMA